MPRISLAIVRKDRRPALAIGHRLTSMRLVATVRCVLSDGTKSLGPLRVHAYLAEQDDVPTLIGMLGFIERGILHVDVSRGRAFVRM